MVISDPPFFKYLDVHTTSLKIWLFFCRTWVENLFVKIDHFKRRFHNFRIGHWEVKNFFVNRQLVEKMVEGESYFLPELSSLFSSPWQISEETTSTLSINIVFIFHTSEDLKPVKDDFYAKRQNLRKGV